MEIELKRGISLDVYSKMSEMIPFDFGGGSNYGDHIDLIAPGVDIAGSALGGGHEAWSGTSQATALVSGAVGLLLSQGAMTPQQVRMTLHQTALDGVGRPFEDLPGWDQHHGAGAPFLRRARGRRIAGRDRRT